MCIFRKSFRRKRSISFNKTTRMLVLISTVFLIVHSPICYSKISYCFKESQELIRTYNNMSSGERLNVTSQFNNFSLTLFEKIFSEELIERLSCNFYYLSFSLNFFLYTYNKTKFKRNLNRFIYKYFMSNKNAFNPIS